MKKDEMARARHHQGEFYADREESEAWAASPDGHASMRELLRRP
jgi:hypothetical protein